MHSSPTGVTSNLRGVWVGANASASRLDVRVVGERINPTTSTILRSVTTIGSTPPSDVLHFVRALSSFGLRRGLLRHRQHRGSQWQAPPRIRSGSVAATGWFCAGMTRPGPGSIIPFSLITTRLQSNFGSPQRHPDGHADDGQRWRCSTLARCSPPPASARPPTPFPARPRTQTPNMPPSLPEAAEAVSRRCMMNELQNTSTSDTAPPASADARPGTHGTRAARPFRDCRGT